MREKVKISGLINRYNGLLIITYIWYDCFRYIFIAFDIQNRFGDLSKYILRDPIKCKWGALPGHM